MSSVTIWALESDYDAKTVKHLAEKLLVHLQLSNVFIRAVGKRAIPKRQKNGSASALKLAVNNYLKDDEDDCVIFVIDTDGPMASHQRRQEANSLINQVTGVVEDSSFTGRVYLAWAVTELEAWLLIDCLGIACYFATKKRKQYRRNCREKVSGKQAIAKIVKKYQHGDTELIVEAEIGGKGVKEYLIRFSKALLLEINPNMPQKNIKREVYQESFTPDIAKFILINDETLRRNASLKYLGDLIARCA